MPNSGDADLPSEHSGRRHDLFKNCLNCGYILCKLSSPKGASATHCPFCAESLAFVPDVQALVNNQSQRLPGKRFQALPASLAKDAAACPTSRKRDCAADSKGQCGGGSTLLPSPPSRTLVIDCGEEDLTIPLGIASPYTGQGGGTIEESRQRYEQMLVDRQNQQKTDLASALRALDE